MSVHAPHVASICFLDHDYHHYNLPRQTPLDVTCCSTAERDLVYLDALYTQDDSLDGDFVNAFMAELPSLLTDKLNITVSTPRVTVSTSAPTQRKAASAAKPTKLPARRIRKRKRSDKEKQKESSRRHARQLEFRQRRRVCLDKEAQLRRHIRRWVHQYAAAIGMAADETILPYLPSELRAIMDRSDASIATFRGFAGVTLLTEEINQLPMWW